MHPLLSEFEQTVSRRQAELAVSDPSLALEYGKLHAVAMGLANAVAAGTQRPTVGILAPTSSAGAAAIFACWYAGKIPVPLNFLLSPEEIGKIIRDAELDLVLTIQHFVPTVTAAGLRTLILDAKSIVPGTMSAPDRVPSDTAVMIYTSGTSGDPKGVCLTFNNLISNAHASIEHARLTPDQRFLSILPQFHSFGFTAMTVIPLLLGATVYFLPRFSPTTIMNTLVEKQISVFMAIASMWGALSGSKNMDASTFKSVRIAISGGEPLPPKVAQLFEEKFGLRICEGYGLTETSPVVSINTPHAYRTRSVGRAIPGVQVVALDPQGATLPTGADGELVISGHCVMKEYHNKPKETAATIRNGRLHTGDMGHVDADGYIFITGRIKEMMIVGGENVFPIEIESVVADHPAVAEAAVIGVVDDVRGEVPVAFVILREGATATDTDIREFCRTRLAGYKVPRQVVIRAELPRGGTGKILKRALKQLLPAAT